MVTYKIPWAKVRSLSFDKNGTGHWWLQRVTAVALVPLTYFILKLFALCINAGYAETLAWFSSLFNSMGLTTWLIAAFYHAALGLHIVIEDYVAGAGKKTTLIWVVNISFILLALAALITVFRIITL